MKRLAACVIVGLFLLATWSVPSARGIGTITFTSTSDFDNGTKGNVTREGSWEFGESYPLEFAPSAAGFGNFLYAFGGFDSWFWDDRTYRYNVTDDTWFQLSEMNGNRSDMGTTVWTDRIYAFSGSNCSSPCGSPGTFQSVATTEYYNVTTDIWVQVADNPFPGEGPMTITYNDFIYLTDGIGNVRKYTPSSDTYDDLGCAITVGSSAANGVVGTNWYFVGASTNVRRFNLDLETCDNAYDTVPFLPLRHQGPWSNPIIDGRIYIVGGFTDGLSPNTFVRETWEYEPIGKGWAQMTSPSIARTVHGNGIINGRLFIVGGLSDQNTYKAVRYLEIFNPNGETGDGHNQVETSTDSRVFVSGSFGLANGLSEQFYKNDYIGDMVFFDQIRQTNEGSCTHVNEGGTHNITPVRAFLSNAGPHCGFISNGTWTGDFDIRVNVQTIYEPGTSNGLTQIQILNQNVVRWNANVQVDGTLIQVNKNGANRDIEVFTVTNGGASACGSNPTTLNASARYLRITSVGTTYTFYHNLDGSEAWTQFRTCTNANTGPWYFVVDGASGTSGTIITLLRDFYLMNGTLNGWYRESGNWTGPIQAWTGEVPGTITIDYTSASSTQYIDAVSLLSSSGSVIYTDGTNRVTGSSVDISIPSNVQNGIFGIDWAVRLTLASDGNGTVIIGAVTIETTRSLIAIATSDAPMLFVFVGILVAGLAGAAWIRNKRGGGR